MNKNKKTEMFNVKEVVTLLVMTCVANVTIFFFMNYDKQSENNLTSNDTINEIMESYNYIKENYYGEIDEKDLINGAIKGMTEALGDNYSSFIEESESDTYDIILKGDYMGVGIQISQLVNNKDIIISQVFENSPAMESGLQAGDIVKKINGESTDDMTVSDVGDYIKNGDIVNFDIVIERNGVEEQISTKRGKITIDSVYSEMIENNGKKVGYIMLDVFALNTDEQFKQHLENLEKQGMDSLIIDVRSNTGGHLSTVTNIISEFLDKSKVIYQTSSKTETKKIYSTGKTTKQYKIVVLADGVSASASEVLLAALKESYGATFVGQATYGKGTVQEMQEISSTGESYKITTKKWLTPLGNWINNIGIEPDYEIELGNEYYINPTKENDNQLQKALELLK